MRQSGFEAQEGQIVDASIVKVRVRRDTKENNQKIKNGEEVTDWSPATRIQKDTDASWTVKAGQRYFGYKNHICPDVKHKLIRSYAVTSASVHDSKVFEALLSANNDPTTYADSAYFAHRRIAGLYAAGRLPCINEKSSRHHKLTAEERQANRCRSQVRIRVEHVFGHQAQRAGHLLLRSIGLARAQVKIGLRNLAYNLERYSMLVTMT